jgi:hypothetical protein
MITLTREEAQQVLEALNRWKSFAPEYFDQIDEAAIETLRARLAEPEKEQEPVALPDWPERESLADLEYAQTTPEDWTEDYKQCWQQLQVCERNKIILHKYAKTLRSMLLQQKEQEPVAWWHETKACHGGVVDLNVSGHGRPLYFAPPQRTWQGLTYEEMNAVYRQAFGLVDSRLVGDQIKFVSSIEAKLKEKNT